MKLGEALTLRKDLQVRIEQIRARLRASAVAQEGEEPVEDPNAMLEELGRLADELERVIERINRTNLATMLPDGRSLTTALARRDSLNLRQTVLRQLADAAGERQQRYGRAEIRILPTVNVAAIRRQIDGLAQERRLLDAALQETNWTTDL